MPWNIQGQYYCYFLTDSLLVVASRLVRIYYSHYHKDSIFKNLIQKIFLIGAGKTGEKTPEKLDLHLDIDILAGFVDDNPEKHGALLHGKNIW